MNPKSSRKKRPHPIKTFFSKFGVTYLTKRRFSIYKTSIFENYLNILNVLKHSIYYYFAIQISRSNALIHIYSGFCCHLMISNVLKVVLTLPPGGWEVRVTHDFNNDLSKSEFAFVLLSLSCQAWPALNKPRRVARMRD